MRPVIQLMPTFYTWIFFEGKELLLLCCLYYHHHWNKWCGLSWCIDSVHWSKAPTWKSSRLITIMWATKQVVIQCRFNHSRTNPRTQSLCRPVARQLILRLGWRSGSITLCAASLRFWVSRDNPRPTVTPGRRLTLYAKAAMPRSLILA